MRGRPPMVGKPLGGPRLKIFMVSQQAPALAGGPAAGLTGQVVGSRFTCFEQIGQDLLGPIYRAQRSDGTVCTLQPLQQRYGAQGAARRELDRDLRAAAALRHPCLGGPVELFFDEQGAAYLIREALSGETLEARLQRLGRPPVEAAFDIIERVAGALRAAHRKQLLHLHVGPDKVFLQQTPRGATVRLLDLGVARLVRPEDHVGGLARPRYAAPEQVVSPRRIEARADVYSLGLLLYELLSGRPPFSSRDSEVLLAQHVNDTAPALADRAPDRLFSAELEGLLASMLAKAPQDRPRDAGALLTRLQQLRQEGDLVIALDDREAGLLSEWSIAPAGPAPGGEADLEVEERRSGSDLPGLPERYRSSAPPAPPRPASRRPSGAQHRVIEEVRRSGPRPVVPAQEVPDHSPTPPAGGARPTSRPPARRPTPPGGTRPASRPPAPQRRVSGEAAAVRRSGPEPIVSALAAPPVAPVAATGAAGSPGAPLPRPGTGPEEAVDIDLSGLSGQPRAQRRRSASGALDSLLLPSRTGESRATSPLRRAGEWLRETERVLSRDVPRYALGLVGLGCALGICALLIVSLGRDAGASGRGAALTPAAEPRVTPRPAPAEIPPAPPRLPAAAAPRSAAVATALIGPVGAASPRSADSKAPAAAPRAAALRLAAAPVQRPAAAPRPGRRVVAAAPRPAPASAERTPSHSRHRSERPRPAVPRLPTLSTAAPSVVTVRILSAPTGAQVLRDGQVLGTTPFSEALRRGAQPLAYEVVRAGYEPARVEVVPTADRVLQLDLSPIMLLR